MSHYPQSPWKDDSPDPVRFFIRRNRKKILIFLGIGVVLVIAAFVTLAVFFFTVVLSAGSDIAKQAVPSGNAAGATTSFLNWIQQTLKNANLMQWVTLLLQFNN